MVAKVDMECNGISEKKTITCAYDDREPVIPGETRRAEPRDQIKLFVVGAALPKKHFARQNVVAKIQVVVSQNPQL